MAGVLSSTVSPQTWLIFSYRKSSRALNYSSFIFSSEKRALVRCGAKKKISFTDQILDYIEGIFFIFPRLLISSSYPLNIMSNYCRALFHICLTPINNVIDELIDEHVKVLVRPLFSFICYHPTYCIYLNGCVYVRGSKIEEMVWSTWSAP